MHDGDDSDGVGGNVCNNWIMEIMHTSIPPVLFAVGLFLHS